VWPIVKPGPRVAKISAELVEVRPVKERSYRPAPKFYIGYERLAPNLPLKIMLRSERTSSGGESIYSIFYALSAK